MLHQLLILSLVVTALTASSVSDYLKIRQSCEPESQNGGIVTKENSGKVCFPGSKCNNSTKICDCSDSDDGKWKRTWESDQCKLLPGSKCVQVNQEFYRCVSNSQCTQTRKGEDVSLCPADAPCDVGDFACICEPGKTCITERVSAPVDLKA